MASTTRTPRTSSPRTVPQGDRIPGRPDSLVIALRLVVVLVVLVASMRGILLDRVVPWVLPDALPDPTQIAPVAFPNPLQLMQIAPTGPPDPVATAPGAARPVEVQVVHTVLRVVYYPPGSWIVVGGATLGLLVLLLELSVNAVLWVTQTRRMRRLGTTVLRMRLPREPGGTARQGEDILRTLHRALPHYGAQSGRAPWLALTLGAAPDDPVTVGAVLSGGDAAQRDSLAVFLRKTLIGFDASVVVDSCNDPVAATAQPGTTMVWQAFTLLHAPSYPVRLPDDAATDVLGPLLATLRGRTGTAYTEYAVILRPRHDWDLMNGWRAYAVRRMLQLRAKHQYSLTPDVRALQDKIDSPSYDVTLLVQVVAQPGHLATAQTELREVATVIESQYQARSGSFLQRFAYAGRGMVRLPTQEAPPWMHRTAMLLGSSGAGAALLGLLLTLGGHAWLPTIRGLLPVLAAAPLGQQILSTWVLPVLLLLGAALLGPAVLRQRWGMVAQGQRAWLLRRPPRPTPLAPFLLPARIWRSPSILSAAELSGLWHLPATAWGPLVRWLPCRQMPAPAFAFVPAPPAPDPTRGRTPRRWVRRSARQDDAAAADPQGVLVHLRPKMPDGVPVTTTYPVRVGVRQSANPHVIMGFAPRSDGQLAPVGMLLFYLRQIMHITAGMGAGKSRLLANIFLQFIATGCLLGDGKGDDIEGSLVATVRHLVPLEDEDRLVLLDILDTAWPFGINLLAGVDLARPGGVDMALGQVLAIFARLDPETWPKAPGMQQYVRMAALLVFEAQPGATMAHIKQVLLDADERARLLRHCTNIEVKDFWEVTFPKTSEQQRTSLDALLRRFDSLLATETTRYLLTQPLASFDMRAAMDEGLLVLVPMPDNTLGGMASLVGMLVVQDLVRAIMLRGGSDQTRTTYPIIVDELQVFTQVGSLDDIDKAITRLRSFGAGTIWAHQDLDQLRDLKDRMQLNAQSRMILRTSEPDASTYAKRYAASGVTAMDIANQDAREHQYAVLQCAEGNTGPVSLIPLEWPDPIPATPPPYTGPPWQTVMPPVPEPAAAVVAAIARLVYAFETFAPLHMQRTVIGLAQLPEDEWAYLVRCWDQIGAFHRRYIQAHPGCIPDRMARQRWRSRLRAQQPRVLVAAAYQRQRWRVTPHEPPARVRSRRDTGSDGPPGVVRTAHVPNLAPPDAPPAPIPPGTTDPTFADLQQARGRRRATDPVDLATMEGLDDD